MAGDTVITIVGNLTADPELRFIPSGAAVVNFTVASTPRVFDRQMLLCAVKSLGRGEVGQNGGVDFAGEEPLQAAHDVLLGQSFDGASVT